MGPFLARWNYFLERRFPLRQDGAKAITGAPVVQNVQNAMIKRAQNSGGRTGNVSLTALAKRVGMDQACMAPFGLFVFFSSMGIMEGRSLPAIRQRFADLYGPAIKANWTVWPLIQFVNFRFMPLAYRVPFQATCGVFWTLYISLLNSSEPAAAVQQEEKRPEVEKTREREQDGQRVTTVEERLGRGRKHTY
ncbi:hypothetical protein FRC17_003544 [Serendipita sp. 399]|nr:hypothetical protein FRC17_003544 [Serendipita sp. 399]